MSGSSPGFLTRPRNYVSLLLLLPRALLSPCQKEGPLFVADIELDATQIRGFFARTAATPLLTYIGKKGNACAVGHVGVQLMQSLLSMKHISFQLYVQGTLQ